MNQPQVQTSEPEAEAAESEVEQVEQDNTPPAAETQETVEDPSQEEGFDPRKHVEFSTPDQQKKFNDVYKQMRMSDNRNKMLTSMLEKAVGEIDELKARFSQTDHAEAERILNTRLKEARDAGDETKADQIMQEIIDFRVKGEVQKLQPKDQPKLEDVENSPDVMAVVSYAQETDNSGNLLRPWISDKHPQHANAMKMASIVAMQVNADLGYVDIPEVMKRMDEAMKPKAKTPQPQQGSTRAPDPMRGNLTNTPPKGKMKLSPQELAIAQKLGVKPEAYLKWKQ